MKNYFSRPDVSCMKQKTLNINATENKPDCEHFDFKRCSQSARKARLSRRKAVKPV
jgi:hypothetical protein